MVRGRVHKKKQPRSESYGPTSSALEGPAGTKEVEAIDYVKYPQKVRDVPLNISQRKVSYTHRVYFSLLTGLTNLLFLLPLI